MNLAMAFTIGIGIGTVLASMIFLVLLRTWFIGKLLYMDDNAITMTRHFCMTVSTERALKIRPGDLVLLRAEEGGARDDCATLSC